MILYYIVLLRKELLDTFERDIPNVLILFYTVYWCNVIVSLVDKVMDFDSFGCIDRPRSSPAWD